MSAADRIGKYKTLNHRKNVAMMFLVLALIIIGGGIIGN